MKPEIADVVRWALMARFQGVEFGPRSWRVKWPTGMIEVVREIKEAP